MRTRTSWLAGLLALGMALTPATAWGQAVSTGYDVPALSEPISPFPLYHTHPEKGGFYSAAQFEYLQLSNPMKHQTIAVRGFNDTDGQIQQALIALGLSAASPNGQQVVPGTFFGSGNPALDAQQTGGPGTYMPGWELVAGWRFSEGSPIEAIEFRWRHFLEAKYNAVASLIPPFRGLENPDIGPALENTFLFSPVFNFPPEFAGPSSKIIVVNPTSVGSAASIVVTSTPSPTGTVITQTVTQNGVTTVNSSSILNSLTISAANNGAVQTPQAAFGIWNGATVMSIDFVQRYDDYEMIGRIPIYQSDDCRCYGLVGPRHVSLWERFHWRTVDVETTSPASSASVTVPAPGIVINSPIATSSNGIPTGIIGAFIPPGTVVQAGQPIGAVPGNSSEQDFANYSNVVSNQMYGPVVGVGSEYYVGHGFSASLDLRAGLMIDVVKEIAKYELGDRTIGNKRAREDYTLAPELDALLNVMWYPIEGVEIRVGYDFLTFFNTISSPRPVDFNFGALAPAYERQTFRSLQGFHAGIGIVF